jgi:hypothetical protein
MTPPRDPEGRAILTLRTVGRRSVVTGFRGRTEVW